MYMWSKAISASILTSGLFWVHRVGEIKIGLNIQDPNGYLWVCHVCVILYKHCMTDICVINSASKSSDKVEQRRARANLNPAICSTLQLSPFMWRRRTCTCWCCFLTLGQHLIQSTQSIVSSMQIGTLGLQHTTVQLVVRRSHHSPSASLPSVWALPRAVYWALCCSLNTTVVGLTRDDYNLAYWELQWSQQPDAEHWQDQRNYHRHQEDQAQPSCFPHQQHGCG